MADPMRYVGVDPGLSGALACVGGGVFLVEPLRVVAGPDGQDELDGEWLRARLEALNPRLVVLERVQGFGGCSSAFKLGQSYGTIVTATMSLRFRLERVRPQTWQAAMIPGVEGRDKLKRASVALARETWPLITLARSGRCKIDDQSDALLLAEYGRRTFSP